MVDVSCPFCGQCGAPQLSVPAQELPEAAAEAKAAQADASLAAPGGNQSNGIQGTQWKAAVQACLLVAAAAGVLFASALVVPALYTIAFFWTLSGAMIALALYRRRAPLAWMDSGTGAKIGLLTGMFMVSAMTAIGSVFLAAMRFALHKGADFDTQLSDAIHQGMARAAESNPDPQLVQASLKFLLSPEGRAGYTLAMAAFLAVLLVFFSALSGAVGAKLMPRSRKSAG